MRNWLVSCLLALGAVALGLGQDTAAAAQREYQRIVVISDIHLPGKNLAVKQQAVADINGWPDVDLVVVTGDIVATSGTAEEYAFARKFFDRMTKPACFIGGNHDYIYPDSFSLDPGTGHHRKEPSAERRAEKLRRFQETWRLPELFYSRRLGNYLLVFLTADCLTGEDSARLSPRQLQWFAAELQKHRQVATIVFFHAPLAGTGIDAGDAPITAEQSRFVYAQPENELKGVLRDNPQVFLWVAGHVHIAPTNEDFCSPRNVYDGRVMVIHNPNLTGSNRLQVSDRKNTKHNELWTNSLYLYADRVQVRTFDHRKASWMLPLDRSILPPKAPPRNRSECASPACEK